MIPSANDYANAKSLQWDSLNLDEFLYFLGMLLSVEVFKIHGLCKMYWNEEGSNLFPAINFGKIMSRTRSQEIARFLQLSFD